MINDNEISFVVQGPIEEQYIYTTTNSIRRYYPNSEIILSTWEHSNTKNIDHDLLLLNKDPGSNKFGGAGMRNINREIVSTFSGINIANRKYVFKIRSDIEIVNNNALNFMELFFDYDEEYKIFSHRILASNFYTLRSSERPFYVSDFCYLGRKRDMYKLFNLDLAEEIDNNIGGEEYITYGFVKNHNPNIEFNMENSDKILANNFIILESQAQMGVKCQKHPEYYDGWHSSMMRHLDWFELYNKEGKK